MAMQKKYKEYSLCYLFLPSGIEPYINRYHKTSFPGDNSGLAPPDSISNSEVKHTCANDSVRSPHAKVGHRQDFIHKKAA
jgi:hypothetical protein